MNITVHDGPYEQCEQFIRSIVEAKLCHLPEWTIMKDRIFGHKGHYLIAHGNGCTYGVLPLTYVRSKLLGNRFVSQPFCITVFRLYVTLLQWMRYIDPYIL